MSESQKRFKPDTALQSVVLVYNLTFHGSTSFHHRVGVFSWHAPRNGCRSRRRRDYHRKPRAHDSQRRAHRGPLGTRPHYHHFSGWFAHHFVWHRHSTAP